MPLLLKPLIDLYPSQVSLHALLQSWDGRLFQNHLRYSHGERWVYKPLASSGEQLREILASRIGRGIVNVAQALCPRSFPEFGRLDPYAVYSRLAYDYSLESLPLRDLDSATAGELVFSTLIRRRDAHEFNRGYTCNLPVCFDNHVAFDAEETGAEDIQTFFSRSEGSGYAGDWRAYRISSVEEVSDHFRNAEWGARHFYFSEDAVRKHAIEIASKLIMRIDGLEYLTWDLNTDRDELSRIERLLNFTRSTAMKDVRYMLEYVFSYRG